MKRCLFVLTSALLMFLINVNMNVGAQGTPSELTGKILYQSNEGTGDPERYNFYILDLPTGERTKITDNQDTTLWYPAVSPDGSEISYFNAEKNDDANLFIMSINGTGSKQITQDLIVGFSSWSPDGTQLMIEVLEGDTKHLYLINRNSMGLTRLTNSTGYDQNPKWSPDGKYILFKRDQTKLVRIDADGSNETLLYAAHASGSLFGLSWFGSLDRIAYVVSDSSTSKIFTADWDGTNSAVLVEDSQYTGIDCAPKKPLCIAVEFAQDTSKVGDQHSRLIVIDEHGNKLKTLTDGSAREVYITWITE